MSTWAILSGLAGNLAAYEAVLADIGRSPVDQLFILGDVLAPAPSSRELIQRLRRQREPEPQICRGWWEEQLLILHGLGPVGDPTELIERYGMAMVKQLWDAIPRDLLDWVRSLEFGFFELDCLLIHGSSVSVSEPLTPDTPPLQMLDRLLRVEANTLFCGRSGLAFQYEIQQGSVTSSVTTLDRPPALQTARIQPRRVIGVGAVGTNPGQATYTLYHPNTDRVEFKTVRYGAGKGFQAAQR
jgi:hypothetical protein